VDVFTSFCTLSLSLIDAKAPGFQLQPVVRYIDQSPCVSLGVFWFISEGEIWDFGNGKK
jgi:hypothetical protein